MRMFIVAESECFWMHRKQTDPRVRTRNQAVSRSRTYQSVSRLGFLLVRSTPQMLDKHKKVFEKFQATKQA